MTTLSRLGFCEPSTIRTLVLAGAVASVGCYVVFLRRGRRRNFEQASVDVHLHSAKRAKRTKSLIPETLLEIESLEIMPTPKDEVNARDQSLSGLKLPTFAAKLAEFGVSPLKRRSPKVVQINIGLYCNQACNHCHVESSPLKLKEQMSPATLDRCIDLMKSTPGIHTLDITGGAPELNRGFRSLVSRVRALYPKLRIIDRCNLTVLIEPDMEDLPNFLREHRVDVIASLPCYSEKNVDAQRGRKVFERSIEGLLRLNEQGYGEPGTGLKLDLVYNPAAGFLPPPQSKLEVRYKEELKQNHDINFNELIVITNMPIKRFCDFLRKRKELDKYMELLVRNFNPDTVKNGLMCHDTVSISWEGKIFDCDFNQQLDLQLKHPESRKPMDVWSIDTLADISKSPIVTRAHCFGCTAGQGSS